MVMATLTPVLDYADDRPRSSRWLKWLMLLASSYSLLLLFSLYMTAIVAAICLGHWPRPSLDDPKYISPVVEIPYALTACLLMGLPVGVVLNIVVLFVHAIRLWEARVPLSRHVWPWLFGGMLWMLGILVLSWDPLGVLYWYMD
jgi:hypothetical protein